jgi:HK97 family phage major capsid protein
VATILEKRQRLSAISDRQKALKSNYEKNKSFSQEERDETKALSAEVETLKTEIAALEAQEAEDRKFLAAADVLAADLAKPLPRQTQPDSLGTTAVIDGLPNAKPAKFASLGEQLQAIANAGMHGDNPVSRDNRLKWETLAPSGAAASVPSDGGYLIQKDFLGELITRMNEYGEIKNRVRTIPIGPNSDGLKIFAVDETSRATGSRWGGVQMYWGAEADTATAKKPKFRQMELELKDLIGLAYVTNRMLADASAVEAVFMQAFTEEGSFMCEDALVNGTGAGMPMGILACPALVSVSKETGQAAATLVKENIDKMWARMWGRSRKNAIWLINQDIEPQLAGLKHDIGTGGVPVYLPPGGLSESPYALLKGRPVIPAEYCATLGTVGDIILADFSQVIAIEKGAMQADSSIHVKFVSNEMTYRFIYRYDAQPVWNAAMTPFKGSNTQSPFVALATRS